MGGEGGQFPILPIMIRVNVCNITLLTASIIECDDLQQSEFRRGRAAGLVGVGRPWAPNGVNR
jgi:hypothetical protein